MGDGIRRFGDAYSPAIPISEDARGRFVLFTDHEAALAAAVEERDREIERLKQGLWDCAGAAGTDLDGDPTPRHLAYPDIVDFALNAVRELRRDYDEGLGEAALVAPAVTTGLEMNTNPEGTRNLD